MASTLIINEFDSGITFTVTVTKRSDGSPVNLFDAQSVKIVFGKPSGASLVVFASVVGDGTDGQAQYVAQPNDFNEVGRWSMQSVVQFSLNSIQHSDITVFKVQRNLPTS